MDSAKILSEFVRENIDLLKPATVETSLERIVSLKQRERWSALLGRRYQEFLSNRSVADAEIGNPQENIRLAAYQLTAHYWGPNKQLVPAYLHSVLKDSNSKVKSAAVICLMLL